MKKVLLLPYVIFIFTSCVRNSTEHKKLQNRNDSLTEENAKMGIELDRILTLFNEVEENFKNIKVAENYLSIQSGSTSELVPSVSERIQNDMQFVTETLEKNRQRIAELEKKLKKSNLNSTQLKKALDNLRKELEEKTNELVILSDELAKKDQQIAKLSMNIADLSNDVQMLKAQSDTRDEIIKRQQTEINTVYYCFGTSKELKDKKILEKGQLGKNFNRELFIRIENLNTLTTIPLYAQKGKLISKHPDNSYKFGKDNNGKAELYILDPKRFWSLTKFLVIEVNV